MKTIQKSDFFKVAIAAIIVEKGFNVRTDLGDIDALAKSIATLGQQVPIIATKVRGEEKFLLTAGHRRLAAIEIANKKYGAKITHVNVMGAKGDEKTRILTMLLDGEGSKTLSNEEMVAGISRLIGAGVPKKEIVDSLAMSISQAQRYNLVKAASAPTAIQKMLEDGLISVALVNEIQRTTKDEVEQVKLAEEAIANANSEEDGEPKKKATASKAKTSKVSADVSRLEAAIDLAIEANPASAKAAVLKAIVNKLKAKASAEDIAKLLK
jgi:ParB-like chromosome segregation protein Spo0J